MKKAIAIILTMVTLFGCLAMSGCGSKRNSNPEYGYYTRSDGKRIWFKTR